MGKHKNKNCLLCKTKQPIKDFATLIINLKPVLMCGVCVRKRNEKKRIEANKQRLIKYYKTYNIKKGKLESREIESLRISRKLSLRFLE